MHIKKKKSVQKSAPEKKPLDKKLLKKKVFQSVCSAVIAAAVVCGATFGIIAAENKVGYGKFCNYDYVYLIAHRGYSDAAPENTLPAFTEAGKSGAFYGAECDARCTKDGVWVVFHDEDVERMTDGKGKVEDMTYAELHTLTVDSGSNIANYPNLKIPMLEEYLSVCKQYKLRPYIEIKETDVAKADSLYQLLYDRKWLSRVTLLSFDKDVLRELHKKETTLDLFLLTKTISHSDIKFCEDNNCMLDFDQSRTLNTIAKINRAQKKGLTLGAWVVGDTDSYIRLFDNGVLYFTCNSPIEL